jgi:ubiquinone/menaquinone biosynthesis C-methylase UbiE
LSPPNPEKYVIRGGRAGYDRLQILARSRWPQTSALFHRAGVAPGMRSLDMGCGGGAVTFEIAKLVAPGGSVVGVDMDAVKLDLARREAADQKLANIEFRAANANDWREDDTYDFVFSRFLLQHLRAPADLLRRMWAAVRPGGLLIVEDVDFHGWCCDPPNEAFDFFVRTYNRVLEHNGGDPGCGRKLLRYFREVGTPEPKLDVVQPFSLAGEAKTLPYLTLEATAATIIESGVATGEEVDAALASLEKFTKDPQSLISGPRIFELWVRRPSAS